MAETQLTMGSLFDGAGGFPLAAVRSGIKPLWASEIEPLPIRVTRARFPEMEHLGDISKIHGGAIPPVDVITFGSPCFPAGTLILTERGHVPIEDVTADDRVLTHRGRWRQVTATGNRTADTIVLSDGVNHLECTSNHPILEYGPEEQWTQAGDMQGRQWCLSGMWRNRIAATVRRISGGRQNQTVYNLAVADDESYTANRIIVHNCQDLSVAGKREGLKGGRSGLFHEAIRVIREMREATGGQRPRICLWENVSGAFSSNGGADFGEVLRSMAALAGKNYQCARPERWSKAGTILADGFRCEWRLVDARYWGVPQMRRRIFLVGHFGAGHGGEEPAGILFDPEGMSGNPPQGTRDGQGDPGDSAGRTKASGGRASGYNYINKQEFGVISETAYCLTLDGSPIVVCEAQAVDFNPTDSRIRIREDNTVQTLLSRMGTGGNQTPLVLLTHPQSGDITISAEVFQTLTGKMIKGGADVPLILNGVYCLPRLSRYTDTSMDISPALTASDNKGPQCVSDGGIIRRITPLECCRLQGFPDDWCDGLIYDEVSADDLAFWRTVWDTWCDLQNVRRKTDSQIMKWLKTPPTDGALYKMWGNSVAIPCVEAIMHSIAKSFSDPDKWGPGGGARQLSMF